MLSFSLLYFKDFFFLEVTQPTNRTTGELDATVFQRRFFILNEWRKWVSAKIFIFYSWEGQVYSVLYTEWVTFFTVASESLIHICASFSYSLRIIFSYFLISSPKQVTGTKVFALISAFRETLNSNAYNCVLMLQFIRKPWDVTRKGVNIAPKWI